MPAGRSPIDPSAVVPTLMDRLTADRSLPSPSVAPALSYGRHRGPVRPTARIAAVAVTLYQQGDGQWIIPLTLRPQSLQHHAGQVCLPGGEVESDETPFIAAMREFEEELGVPAEVTQQCGELASQYVYASNNLVHPVVAIIHPPQQPWRPDPVEVAEVIPLPLAVLMEHGHRFELELKRKVVRQDRPVDEFRFRAPAFRCGDHTVWGATALILDQLAQILRRG